MVHELLLPGRPLHPWDSASKIIFPRRVVASKSLSSKCINSLCRLFSEFCSFIRICIECLCSAVISSIRSRFSLLSLLTQTIVPVIAALTCVIAGIPPIINAILNTFHIISSDDLHQKYSIEFKQKCEPHISVAKFDNLHSGLLQIFIST